MDIIKGHFCPWPQIFTYFKFNFPKNFCSKFSINLLFPADCGVSCYTTSYIRESWARKYPAFSFLFNNFVKKLDSFLSNFQIFRTFSEKFKGNARRFSRICEIFQNFPAGARKKKRETFRFLSLVTKRGARQLRT